MNRAVFIAGLVLIASPASAHKGDKLIINPVYRPGLDRMSPPPVEPPRDPRLPPLKYDLEFAGEMVVRRGHMDEVMAKCLRDKPILGCAFRQFNGQMCTVWTVYDYVLKRYMEDFEIVFRHEQGHCNGWTHEPKPAFEPRYYTPNEWWRIVVVQMDNAPTDIDAAHRTMSVWQTDCVSLKLRSPVTWALRSPAAAWLTATRNNKSSDGDKATKECRSTALGERAA